MSKEAISIHEKGTLRLLTPLALPEQTLVRLAILSEEEPTGDLRKSPDALIAAGLIRPATAESGIRSVSRQRRTELIRLYGPEGRLSEVTIADRHGR